MQTERADEAPAEPAMSRPRLTAALVSSALFIEPFDFLVMYGELKELA